MVLSRKISLKLHYPEQDAQSRRPIKSPLPCIVISLEVTVYVSSLLNGFQLAHRWAVEETGDLLLKILPTAWPILVQIAVVSTLTSCNNNYVIKICDKDF
jgi:hypothetical protein